MNTGVIDTVCTISNAGIVTATSFVETSDARVKESIQPVDVSYSMDKLMSVDIKEYSYTFDSEKKLRTGVIAQEVELVLPELVEISKRYGLDDFHSVQYTGFIPHLINAIKCLQRQVDELKSQIQK